MFKKIKKWFLRPKNPAGNVYYAKLRTPQGDFYKLGYTSKPSLVERMAYGNSGDEKLINHQFFFTFCEDAWDVEQTLLEHFDKQRAFGRFSNDPKMPLSGRGQSELFVCDVLGLDEDLYRLPDEDTLKAIRDNADEAGAGCLFILIGLILIPFTLGISLFFILGGISGIFGKKEQPVFEFRTRPVHPPAIQKLIDALNRG
ncbi:hypothetical protein ETQ85_03120 [Zoogloea oleivorans]|uniref:Uncharacterized protein n=1 Tax=Zoogloea oleivorans TaxID=1552750 RepID=A0A6C2D6J0_9RHOO|nr:hypothetical protein [Zoogloea oleivorans]TYC61661.1 hypothetical protein ETQ85_03120 [Zoogloea oleivorans]